MVGVLTVSDTLPMFDKVRVLPADCTPTTTVPKFTLDGVSVAPTCVPKPLTFTTSGLDAAFEAMLTVPVRAPALPGANAAFTVHIPPGTTVPHAVAAVKLADAVALLITRLAVPVLVTVIGCVPEVVPTGWLPKLMLVVLRLTAGAVTTPVPVTAAVCGLPVAESDTKSVADLAPEVVGLKVTPMLQLCPPATVKAGIRLKPEM